MKPRDDPWWRRPTAKTRRVDGGIKAQSKRGAFGERWWAKRWIGVLEGFGLGNRLTRGRAYARAGQVTAIAIQSGGVRASVQGSRPKPYAVTIDVAPLSAMQWSHVGKVIARTPHLAAKLLSGEMPEDIESAFTEAKCGLFPQSIADVRTACSCPDWSNPCKHVAAVYYLIGEEFDRDPFLLFTLRGLARDAILPLIAAPEPPAKKASRARREHVLRAASADAFWNGSGANERRDDVAIELPPVDAWLVRSAGRFPFWRGAAPLEDALRETYAKAARDAVTRLSEIPGDASRDPADPEGS